MRHPETGEELLRAGQWESWGHTKTRDSLICVGCQGEKTAGFLVCDRCYIRLYTNGRDGLIGYYITQATAAKITLFEEFGDGN